MQYDPIKRTLGRVFNSTPTLRVAFYRMLDVLLLRSWHIVRELRLWAARTAAGPASLTPAAVSASTPTGLRP